jgi:prophage tail gpP-like protein
MSLRVTTDSGKTLSIGSLTLTRGLERAVSTVQLETYDNVLASLGSDPVTVEWQGSTVFRGYIEEIAGNPRQGFALGLRSLVLAFDKYEASGTEYFQAKNSVRAIVSRLKSRVGVDLGSIVDASVNKFRIKRGTSYREALQELAESTQLVVTDDRLGRLVLYAAPSQGVVPQATWTEGRAPTIEILSVDIDTSDLRAEYACRGQRILVEADFSGGVDNQLRADLLGAVLPVSRLVLPNRAASSRADATRLLDWTSKKALGRAIRVTVLLNKYPGDPGFLVVVKSRNAGPGGRSGFKIDETFLASEVQANFVTQRFAVSCVLPEVYEQKRRVRQSRFLQAQNWSEA